MQRPNSSSDVEIVGATKGLASWKWGRRGGVALALCISCGGEGGSTFAERAAPQRSSESTPVWDAGIEVTDAATPVELSPSLPVEEEPPTFVDPVCPNAPVRSPVYECDPWASESGCEPGDGCFPVVLYPRGPCEVERFGAVCRPAGSGTQGEACGDLGCAAGHVCVSTQRGRHCAQSCAIGTAEPTRCNPGLLCQPIDIDGFGACL